MLVTETIPAELVEALLREHLADPTARISDLQVEPILTDGYSGNLFYRARVGWAGGVAAGAGSATRVLKRWLPGGHSEYLLGVDRPLEALAWEEGILRPEALPAGVVVPFVGARLDPSGDAAWIVMEDVSAALREYSRERPLPPADAVARVKQVLDGLARLHAWWERPRQQAKLRRYSGLVPFERFLWCQAASYATVLGRTPPAGASPGSPVTDEFHADVHAFLTWLPAGHRSALEGLLFRREPLVAALGAFPRTRLHGDVDDRNVGLRHRPGRAATNGSVDASSELVLGASSELVLIDWEWIAVGPPALDVARLCGSAVAICDPSQPLPEALFSGELPDYYFERYRAHGGALADRDAWRRSFDLALLAGALTQVPFAGSMIRHGVGPVVATFERQVEMILPAVSSLGPP
jgi:hypothetical protein